MEVSGKSDFFDTFSYLLQDSEDPEAAAGLLQREGAEQVHQP
jgi:hypothetical protein